MRTVAAITFILVIVVVGFNFSKRRVVTYRDTNVIGGEISSPLDVIAVHSSKPQYLTINGKTYQGVRGSPPYYLEIPELHSLLFVTTDRNRMVKFNIINLSTKKEISIDGDGSSFGWNIGVNRNPGDKLTDYIESSQTNKIIIATRSLDWKETTILNLDSRSVEKTEILRYDQNNVVTNRIEIGPAK
jgi:hypothetical protein